MGSGSSHWSRRSRRAESLSAHPSRFFTASLTALPSTVLPTSSAMTAFMTLPKSFADIAPVAPTARSTAAASSSPVTAGGWNCSRTAISRCSCWTRSGRLPLVNCSIEAGDDLQILGRLERPALFDFPVHQRRLQHAQGAERAGVLGLHGIDDLLADVFDERHEGSFHRAEGTFRHTSVQSVSIACHRSARRYSNAGLSRPSHPITPTAAPRAAVATASVRSWARAIHRAMTPRAASTATGGIAA